MIFLLFEEIEAGECNYSYPVFASKYAASCEKKLEELLERNKLHPQPGFDPSYSISSIESDIE
jgi:hypothetical protein